MGLGLPHLPAPLIPPFFPSSSASLLLFPPGLLNPRPHMSCAASPIESVKLCICHVLNPIRFLLGGEILQLLIEFPQTPRRLFGSQRRPLRHFLVLTVALAVGVLAVAGGPPVRAVRTAVAGLYGPRAPLDIPSGSRVVSAASPTRLSAGLSASGVDDAGGARADGIGSGGIQADSDPPAASSPISRGSRMRRDIADAA